MTPEQQQYFADMELLFISPGWKELIESFNGFDDAVKDSALGLRTVEEFYIAKGRHDAFQQILEYETFIGGLKKQIEEAEEDAKDNGL